MFPIERLQVYTQAMDLARACAQQAPSIRDTDLRSQLLRAVRSIAANLAEGAGSGSQALFARHVAIALGSAKEAECHLRVALEAGLLATPAHAALHDQLLNLTPRLVRLLAALRGNAKRRSD
ncbi:MAG: four helix bundle protein [Gemmatimonadetes bacterium]|nr:four helix bundle protein [Gemmatimonadota bacterium]